MKRRETRTLHLERDAGGSIFASLSSETPVERSWGTEILSHESSAVDMSRARRGLPLLWSHDHRTLLGRVINIQIGADKKLRGELKFGSGRRAAEMKRDVLEGTLDSISIGYQIDQVTESGSRNSPVYTVTRWMPYEASLVSVPADATVGVGRSFSFNEEKTMPYKLNDDDLDLEGKQNLTRSQRRRARAELEDDDEEQELQILDLGQRFRANDLAHKVLEDGGTVKDMKRALRARLVNSKPESVPVGMYASDSEQRDFARPIGVTRGVGVDAFHGETFGQREQNAYVAGQWLRATLFGDQRAAGWLQEQRGIRAMVTTSNTAGGALVPEELSQAVINLVYDYGLARQECSVLPMNSDTLRIPRRKSQVSAYFIGEEDQINESDGTWDNVLLTARKIGAMTRISSEMAEDAVIDLASFLVPEFARQFSRTEDECLINGDGTSPYGGIQGFLSKISGKAGAVTAAAGHDLFTEIDAPDLAALMAKVPQYARSGSKWYCSQTAYALVFQRLAQAAGGATMVETGNVQLDRYAGFPIAMSPLMPDSTGSLSAAPMLAFGNMKLAATFGDRRAIRVRLDQSRYLEYDQMAVQGTERFDINVHDLGDALNAGPLCVLFGA